MTLTVARDILDDIDTCKDHDTTAGACDECGWFLSQIEEARRIVKMYKSSQYGRSCVCGHDWTQHRQGKAVIVCWVRTCNCQNYQQSS